MDHLDLLPAIVTIVNAIFTILRIAANVPQLIAILRDPCGARAISVTSWSVFAAANASNGVYALVLAGDFSMFAVNLVSAFSCATIAMVAWSRQRQARARERAAADPGIVTAGLGYAASTGR